ncbi:CIA30 family protein [Formosa sediminum]|uniref:CIA30 family protein n=1 Tax=Formosa sediminum TaxID=2594004 RepID=A0A516GQU5_9FLAO|nr:CIA30 family protein [Formosa sediminum]QDO93907.1 CIA30 family protein [Formosa sediminum]
MKKEYHIFKFNKTAHTSLWTTVNDNVMGGKSSSHFSLNKVGHGVFEGDVSLEDNGGFASVKYRFNALDTAGFSKIILNVKGDGKRYQFRIKDRATNKHAYISYFTATTEWQHITIYITDMYPTFKGQKLDLPNFNASHIEEVAFLIANKKEEHFKLEIAAVTIE